MPLNTDILLAPVSMAPSERDALHEVVNANTNAMNQIKADLTKLTQQPLPPDVSGPDKLREAITNLEQAMQDLGMKSQKVEAALKASERRTQPSMGAVAYGQYPIDRPLNRDNPVQWPPGYVPQVSQTVIDAPTAAALAREAKEQPSDKTAPPSQAAHPTHQAPSQPASGGKK